MEEKYNLEGVYTKKKNTFHNANGIQIIIATVKSWPCSKEYCGRQPVILLYRTKDNPYGSVFSMIVEVDKHVYHAERGDVKYLITYEDNALVVKIKEHQEPEQPLTPMQIIMFNAIKKFVELDKPYTIIENKLLEGLDKSNRSKHKAKIKYIYDKVVSK